MIGIVAVSHSATLGETALQLASQMIPGGEVPVRVAAGAGSDAEGMPILGTDAMAVAAAIDALAESCDGVVVLMDLGSAVLSAELALELRGSEVPVRLSPGPFVEGLLAAVVAAGAGGDLDTVADEAAAALAAKAEQLGVPEAAAAGCPSAASNAAAGGSFGGMAASGERAGAGTAAADSDEQTVVVSVRNPQGIHARPAALIAKAAGSVPVQVRRLPDGPEATASSLMRMLTLGATQGTQLALTARGADAAGVLKTLVALFEDAFGEGTGEAG